MNRFFEKRIGLLPANFIVFGIILILSGCISIALYISFWQIIITLICWGIAIFIFSVRLGIIIDFQSKKFLKYWSIYGKKYGNWTSLSELKYVAIVSIRMRAHYSTRRCTYTTMEYKGRVNLILNKKKYITLFQDTKETAYKDALIIAKGLKVRLYDNSKGKKKWIE